MTEQREYWVSYVRELTAEDRDVSERKPARRARRVMLARPAGGVRRLVGS